MLEGSYVRQEKVDLRKLQRNVPSGQILGDTDHAAVRSVNGSSDKFYRGHGYPLLGMGIDLCVSIRGGNDCPPVDFLY